MENSTSYAPTSGASLHPLRDVTLCPSCGGEGERRYVYCSTCHQYVNGRYDPQSRADEMRGLRPHISLQCGHEAYSLPGVIPCPDCDGARFLAKAAA